MYCHQQTHCTRLLTGLQLPNASVGSWHRRCRWPRHTPVVAHARVAGLPNVLEMRRPTNWLNVLHPRFAAAGQIGPIELLDGAYE
jgi:hypothetical protein